MTQLLTMEQAANLCGFERPQMYYYLREGKSKPPFIKLGCRYFFPCEELALWNERKKLELHRRSNARKPAEK